MLVLTRRTWRELPWPSLTVWLAMAAFFLWYSWYACIQAGVTDVFSEDLAHMWQTVWNVAHGDGFRHIHVPTQLEVSRLGIHADYLLILLAPLSWLWPNYQVLLVVQVIVVAGGAWFVWRLAERLLHRPWLSVSLAVAYLAYGPLQFPTVWQFHAVTLAVPFLLALIEAVVARRRLRVIVTWFLLAVITKEHVGVVAGILVLILYRQQGMLRRGVVFFVGGTVYAAIHFLWLIPGARPEGDPHLVWPFYYGVMGTDIANEISTRLQPYHMWQLLMTPQHGENLLYFLTPLAALPLLSWFFPIGIFMLLPHWIADEPTVNAVYAQNHVLAIPFIFYAAIDGARRLRKWPRLFRFLPVILLFATLVGSVIMSPNVWSLKYQSGFGLRDPEIRRLQFVNRDISPDARVAYLRGVPPIFRNRRFAYTLPAGLQSAEYVVILRTMHPRARPRTRQEYEFYRTYLDASGAFTPLYRSERAGVYRRDLGMPLEAVPDQYVDHWSGLRP